MSIVECSGRQPEHGRRCGDEPDGLGHREVDDQREPDPPHRARDLDAWTKRGRNAACTAPDHERSDRADSKPRQHEGWIRADRRQRAAAALSSVKLLQRCTHSRLFAIDELREFLTGQIAVDPSISRQRFSPFRCDHHGRDDRLETLTLARADPRRSDDGSPVLEFEIDTLFAQRRHVETRQAFCARDRESPHGARLYLRLELGEAVDAERDLSAQDRG